MIFAAGLGTRLKPFTDIHPKALAIVNGKPLLQRNIEYLQSFGIQEFIINVHHFPDQIKDFLKTHDYFGSAIHFSDERDAVLETGGGLKKAAYLLQGKDPFIVMNVDILTDLNLTKLIAYHKSQSPLVTLAVTDRISSRYFLFNRQHELSGWKNERTGEKKIMRSNNELFPKAFSGIHIIDPELFNCIKQDGKFSIVDVYLDLCKEKTILAYEHSGDLLVDVGKPESVQKAEALFS